MMSLKHLLLLLMQLYSITGLLFDGTVIPQKHISVHTPVGEIVGKMETIQFDGKQYNVTKFLGIPYAEPPTGNNRFRKPVRKADFTSPFHAFIYGAACLQQRVYLDKRIPLSEDCLFLNIFVPEYKNSSVLKMPVMIWIHGGGFIAGVSTYNPGDNLSAHGQVIVVTINYRLGHMGFLRTNESVANFGLWDQHFAIKWVSENIASFGGDVNKITIFGESAGSESVNYQVLFPGNKNLFQRAIAQSMGITSGRAFKADAYASEIFTNFSMEAGCTGSHTAIMACLRNKTSDEMYSFINSPTLNYTDIFPNRDHDFVPKHPLKMLVPSADMRKSLDVFYNIDFMMGSCSIDGALYLPEWARALNITNLENFKVSRSIYESEYISGELQYHFSNMQSIPQVAKDMAVFQYTNWSYPNDNIARNIMLIDFITDSRMVAPMVSTAQLHAKGQNGRTFIYEFSIRPTSHLIPVPSWLDGPNKANHADDTFFVFGFSDETMDWYSSSAGRPLRVSDNDIRAAKTVMSLWTNFAKSG